MRSHLRSVPMDIHTDILDKHPENVILFYGGSSCCQKAVPFSRNPAVYEKNVAGLGRKPPLFRNRIIIHNLAGALKSATSGEASSETNSKKNHPGNQRVKCQVCQVSPIVWIPNQSTTMQVTVISFLCYGWLVVTSCVSGSCDFRIPLAFATSLHN